MGDFQAIGDVVTGGMLGRAVEPGAGEVGADGHTHEKNCLNCGTMLIGSYCAACGQKAHVHRSLRGFLQDFVQGLFNFEGKIWRTLPMLAWRPGEMTRRYIAGERARFISPVALYLFTVFAMFAVLNFNGTFNAEPGPIGGAGMQQGLKAETAAGQAKLAKLEKQRAAALADGKAVAEIDRKIAKRKEDIAGSQKVLSGEIFKPTAETDANTPDWLRPIAEDVRHNPAMVSLKIQEAASKYSWLLIPISVPFLWLLFPFRRRYRLYDHTVFVTYSLSFMMMLVIAAGILIAVGSPGLASILFFVPPFHMYWQLKGAYQLGRWGALFRTMALVTFAFIAAGLFFAAAAAIGMM